MDLYSKISGWINKKIKLYETNNENNNTEQYKILVLGEKSSGKTSLINKFCLNEFSLEVKQTKPEQMECYYKSVKILDQIIELFIIDTEETILSRDRKELYSDVKGVVILYDITKTITFEKLDRWIKDVRQMINEKIPIVLVGNKKDLTFLRNVDYEEGVDKSNKNNCEFIETTCIDDDSVDICFKLLTAKIYYNEMPELKRKTFESLLLKEEVKSNRSNSINENEVVENIDKNLNEEDNNSNNK